MQSIQTVNIENNSAKYKQYIIVVILYFIKYYNQYRMDIINNINSIPSTIIDNFFDQPVNLRGGKDPTDLEYIKSITELNPNDNKNGNQDDTQFIKFNPNGNKEDAHFNKFIPYIMNIINTIIDFINKMENNKYTFTEDDKNFILTIIKCLHLNIQPTNGQELYLNSFFSDLININYNNSSEMD